MTSKHTPGPWKASDNFPGVILDDYIIPRQLASVTVLSGSEQEANARLIAAAPDLLAALTRFYPASGCPECSGDCGSANPPVIDCPMRAARDAIAKAEGSR